MCWALTFISHHIGTRDGVNAHPLVRELRSRMDGRYRVTSDLYSGYVGAMREHFEQNVDF